MQMEQLEPSEKTEVKKARCIVYIDGFNWYYGVFRYFPSLKWLNIQSFFEHLRHDDDVTTVKFFTAMVEPQKNVSPPRDRLTAYVRAIRTLPKAKVVLGVYQLRTVRCAGDCQMEYQTPEEKQTDVNIAVGLMSDAVKNLVDSIVIVSGDSDVQPAVRWIRSNYPKIKISVYIPCREEDQENRRNDWYHQMGVPCRFLPLNRLHEHQFAEKLTLKSGEVIERPKSWR